MKRIILLCIFMLLCSENISAQTPTKSKSGNFEKFQIEVLIKQLNIAQKEAADFEEIYRSYANKLKSIREKHRRDIRLLSDEQIEEQIFDSFTSTESIVAIKREFYPRFKSILTPRQILEMYNIERRMNERINSELQKRTKRGGNHSNANGSKR